MCLRSSALFPRVSFRVHVGLRTRSFVIETEEWPRWSIRVDTFCPAVEASRTSRQRKQSCGKYERSWDEPSLCLEASGPRFNIFSHRTTSVGTAWTPCSSGPRCRSPRLARARPRLRGCASIKPRHLSSTRVTPGPRYGHERARAAAQRGVAAADKAGERRCLDISTYDKTKNPHPRRAGHRQVVRCRRALAPAQGSTVRPG